MELGKPIWPRFCMYQVVCDCHGKVLATLAKGVLGKQEVEVTQAMAMLEGLKCRVMDYQFRSWKEIFLQVPMFSSKLAILVALWVVHKAKCLLDKLGVGRVVLSPRPSNNVAHIMAS